MLANDYGTVVDELEAIDTTKTECGEALWQLSSCAFRATEEHEEDLSCARLSQSHASSGAGAIWCCEGASEGPREAKDGETGPTCACPERRLELEEGVTLVASSEPVQIASGENAYGICPDNKLSVGGPQRAWRDQITKAHLARDYNRVWALMKMGAAGGGFSRPMAGRFLHNFLDKGGDITEDYTGVFGAVSRAARADSWISRAKAVQPKLRDLDREGTGAIGAAVRAGRCSGTLTTGVAHVETRSNVDKELYLALGKFKLRGRYKYRVRGGQIIIERVYVANDDYNWDPPRQCGIIDHIIPWTLQRQGKAADFKVTVRFQRDTIKIPLPPGSGCR